MLAIHIIIKPLPKCVNYVWSLSFGISPGLTLVYRGEAAEEPLEAPSYIPPISAGFRYRLLFEQALSYSVVIFRREVRSKYSQLECLSISSQQIVRVRRQVESRLTHTLPPYERQIYQRQI